MKVEIKKIDATQRELRFEIPPDRVAKKTDTVFKDIGKVAKVKGFRKGKVPRNILESHYADTAKEEVVKQLIPEVYQEGIQKEQLVPIDMPDIQKVDFKDGKITFNAVFNVKPEVKIKDYKGLKVTRKSSQATEEDINKTLDYFKQSQGKDKPIEINDDFAKGLGFPSLEEFKKTLSRQIEMDKDRQNRMDVENQIAESLLKKAKVSISRSLVEKQTAHRLEEEKQRMQKQGATEENIKQQEATLKKQLPKKVEREIKIYLILNKIAELEGIKAQEGENIAAKVLEFLFKEAKWT
jgi:FKBP-type peptidyl-prolyl cis-trans isomerase (trigger factor)